MKENLFSMGEYELAIFQYNDLHGTDLNLDVCQGLVQVENPGRTDTTLNDWENRFHGAYFNELVDLFAPVKEAMEKPDKTESDIVVLKIRENKFADEVNKLFLEYAEGKRLDVKRYSKDWHLPNPEYSTDGPNTVPPEDYTPEAAN